MLARGGRLAIAGVALGLALVGCGQKAPKADELVIFGNTNELVNAAGTQAKAKQSSKLTFEMEMAGLKFTGSGVSRQAPDLAAQMTMNTPVGDVEFVLIDRAMYLKAPGELGRQLGASDKPWTRFSADGDDAMSEQVREMFSQAEQQADVTKMLEEIQKSGTITRSAREKLDGADVTHYWITVDVAKQLEALPDGPMKKELREQVAAGARTQDMELWLNADNLPVKVFSAMPSVDGMPGGSVTMRFTDWGAPVDVKAPPADQVGEPRRR